MLTYAAITLEVIVAPAKKDTLWHVTENHVMVRNFQSGRRFFSSGKDLFLHKASLLLFIFLYLDVNECAIRNGGCAHICSNHIGGYHCSCRKGYVLARDAKSCNGE